MAYNNGFGDRIDDIRFRHPQSPRDESYSGYNSPRRANGGYMTTHSQSSNDTRASLQRRFTTDSSKMPTLTPIGQQPGQVGEPVDLSSTVCYQPLLFVCRWISTQYQSPFMSNQAPPRLVVMWLSANFPQSDVPQSSARKPPHLLPFIPAFFHSSWDPLTYTSSRRSVGSTSS